MATAGLMFATVAHANQPPVVTYVWAHQRPGTQIVDVSYNVADPDGDQLTIRLFLSADGGQTFSVPCVSASGAIGSGIQPGNGKLIFWNAGRDVPGLMGANYVLRVVADDGQNVPEGFVLVPPGTFIMGSPTTEPGRNSDETQHQVTLTHSFYVQIAEVTNQQYMEIVQWAFDHGYVTATNSYVFDRLDGSTSILKTLGGEPHEISFSNGAFSCINPDQPTKYVAWYGAAAYCDWLSLQQGLPRAYDHSTWQCNGGNPYTATGYRLPTEAEWEYVCRAGNAAAFANGPITYPYNCSPLDPNLNQVGWYCGNAGTWAHVVAQKAPNAWGVYDMHSNIWEWCNDWYGTYGGSATDPVGSGTSSGRVVRGGSWANVARDCRSALRATHGLGIGNQYVGFRAALISH